MTAYAHIPSASKKLTAFVLFVIGVALTVSLFYVKTQSQTARSEVKRLERAISEKEASIAVLEAELAYRQSPDRLSRLAETYLELEPIRINNTLQISELNTEISLRDQELGWLAYE